MAYAHYQLKAIVGSTVEVDTDGELRLLDDDNYRRFQHGEACQYLYGRDDPNRITVPTTGTWHVIVNTEDDQQPQVRSLNVTASDLSAELVSQVAGQPEPQPVG